MSKIQPCPNCHARPQLRPSGERRYPVLLEHSGETCPARFGAQIYQRTPDEAMAQWNRWVLTGSLA